MRFQIHSKSEFDKIQSNCFQFGIPHNWSSTQFDNGLFRWPELVWGGMSEWIRTNIKIENRYMGYNHLHESKHFDPHPSEYGTLRFLEYFLIPEVKLQNNEKNTI